MQEKKYKRVTLDDRIEIQECLDKEVFFKDAAKRIEKDQTTVSEEVKKHFVKFTSFTKTDEVCPKHLRTPFVCSGCQNRSSSGCHYPKRCIAQKKRRRNIRSCLWKPE